VSCENLKSSQYLIYNVCVSTVTASLLCYLFHAVLFSEFCISWQIHWTKPLLSRLSWF